MQAEAYARWQFNHTRQWIDALFATSYRAEWAAYTAMLAASGGTVQRMVEAEEGLGEAEIRALRDDANASAVASTAVF